MLWNGKVIRLAVVVAAIAGAAWSTASSGQSVDRSNAIRRGFQIAQACVDKYPFEQISKQIDCVMDAAQSAPDVYVRVGITYKMWNLYATAEDILRRRGAAGENAARTIADGYYAPLWGLEEQLFLSARDLCVVTNTDCAAAVQFETGARKRVRAPE